jgi:hypothetical protein
MFIIGQLWPAQPPGGFRSLWNQFSGNPFIVGQFFEGLALNRFSASAVYVAGIVVFGLVNQDCRLGACYE